MPSRAEQIMQAIVAALTVPPMEAVQPAQVYRDLMRAIDKSARAAIALEEGGEPKPESATLAHVTRTLDVRLSSIAKGQGATALADGPIVEAHNRLIADPTLGGLADDIEEGETARQRDVLETEVAVITKTYLVRYRTGSRSLEN